jgi:DNA-directed RNA polymerase subunit RPC12/RpoP
MSTKSVKVREKIDRLMQKVPPLPKGFADWIRKSTFKNSKYVFYKKIGTKNQGLCSACGERIEAPKAKHNEPGRCTKCKARITYKAINKAKRYIDTDIVSIMQETKDGNHVVRYFKIKLVFKNDEDTSDFPNSYPETLCGPTLEYWEGSREFLFQKKNGSTISEQYEELWNWRINDSRWETERKRGVFFNKELLRDCQPFIYKRNLKTLLKKTKWKYCGLEHLKLTHTNITRYLATYEQYPVIEILCKSNYTNLLNDIVEYNTTHFYSSDLKLDQKFLGLHKDVFKTALRLNLKIRGVEFVKTLFLLDIQLKDDHIQWAINNTSTTVFIQLLKWVSPQKLINYTTKHGLDDIDYYTTTWRDYLQQCEKLEKDLNDDIVLFPRNLKEKHDENTKILKIRADAITDKGIKKQYRKWNNKLAFQSGDLSIEVAKSHKSIIDEGKELSHCVGGFYCETMARGGNLILFLKKNNKPYYTVEFNHEKMQVRQNRGFKNASTTKEVDRFIKKWLAHLNKSKERKVAV